jgi:hypothetical protein
MELKDIVAISGIGGLHQVIGRNKSGLIVETIDAGKKRFGTTMQQKISVLADIAIFTSGDDVRLTQVFRNIEAAEAAGAAIPDAKTNNEDLKNFMAQVLPEYDRERVYVSDIKKIAGWYRLLKGLVDFNKEESETETEGAETDATTSEEKSKAKAPSKNFHPQGNKVAAPKGPAGGKSKTNTPRKMGS